MAGEPRGELAEAIAKVAIQEAAARVLPADTTYWAEKPENAAIEPDITVGPSRDAPRVIFLVNASDSPKESEKKFWRNIGEIFDSKSRLNPRPRVCVLVFKSEIKPELIKLTESICDSIHLVDRDPVHGSALLSWLERNQKSSPSKLEEKEALVRSAADIDSSAYDATFAEALDGLRATLEAKLMARREDLEPLWELATKDYLSRKTAPVRKSRTTLLRRGLARWAVFDSATCERVLDCHLRKRAVPAAQVPEYARLLEMLNLSIAGGVIPPTSSGSQDMRSTTGADLRLAAEFFMNAAGGDVNNAKHALLDALERIPDEMRRIAAQLRGRPAMIKSWHQYTIDNWESLRTPRGCFDALRSCASDPTLGGRVAASGEGNWLYEHLIAVLRAHAGRHNDYGYGSLVGLFKDRRNDPSLRAFLDELTSELSSSEARSAQRWVQQTLQTSAEPGRRGFQDWLAGKKYVNPVVIGAFAYSVTEMLAPIKTPAKLNFTDLLGAHLYGLLNKLITYQDYEPLPQLVKTACKGTVHLVSAPTVMADMAERAVQNAATMPALAFGTGLICWKSVTGAGKDHKRKELGGRARALRFTRDTAGFSVRGGAQKLLLVIDGTFDDDDVTVLQHSGWDGIFYPDEMDDLIKAMA